MEKVKPTLLDMLPPLVIIPRSSKRDLLSILMCPDTSQRCAVKALKPGLQQLRSSPDEEPQDPGEHLFPFL
jgi:hypothetical protein